MTARAIRGIARAVRLIARAVNMLRALHCLCPLGPVVAHFSDLSDSVFACVLGWMSNRECF